MVRKNTLKFIFQPLSYEPSFAETQVHHRVPWQQEEVHLCNRKVEDSQIPVQPLLRTAQIQQRDDLSPAQPQPCVRSVRATSRL